MKCPKCKFVSGKEWTVLCPKHLGGCGRNLSFFEWMVNQKWPLIILIPAVIMWIGTIIFFVILN